MNPISWTALAGLLVALSGSAARAGGAPVRKPGLWEAARGDGKVTRLCVDAASDASLHALSMRSDPGDCDAPAFTAAPGGFAVTIGCKSEGLGATTLKASLKGDFNAHYSIDGSAHFATPRAMKSKPGAPVSDLPFKVEMTWRGPCGADLKPGSANVDGVIVDGRTGAATRSVSLDKTLAALKAKNGAGLHHVTPPVRPALTKEDYPVAQQPKLPSKGKPAKPN